MIKGLQHVQENTQVPVTEANADEEKRGARITKAAGDIRV